MLQRTNKLLIGKDISRDAQVVAGALITTTVGSAGLAEGELVVLDKNFKVLAAGSTIADSDIIYICQGTGETYSYTNEAGTASTSNRRLIFSDPIEGAKVRSYKAESYSAKSEQVDSWDLTGITPAAGTEYFVRIVYKDINEHPGQFTQTYRIIAEGATLATNLIDALDAKINAHKGRRVAATNTDTTLVLTGLPIPDCTTSLNDIDEFRQVEFESFINYIDSDGNWAELGGTLTRTPASAGSGTWEQLRDMEKRALPYRGVTNFTMFPVQKPDAYTVKDETYDLIVIEHDKTYLSPDNQYVKQAPLTTIIAIPVPSTTNQGTDILAALNPWMASCPGSFVNVSI